MNDDHTFAPEMTAEEAIQMVLKRPEMYGLQRVTAVPDVATEREIAIIEEHREKWMARAFRAEAERDAALAAIERVRAIAERHGMKPWTEEIFAALDGAPEPGDVWEYEVRNEVHYFRSDYTTDLEQARQWAQTDPHDFIVRRRKAGSWLPVEGESKS